MTVNTSAQTITWTYVEGDWHEGNVPLLGPRSHAMWLGTTVPAGLKTLPRISIAIAPASMILRWRLVSSRP